MPKAKSVDKDNEPTYLYVRSNLDGDDVALHEVDDKHPGGSVIVAGQNVEKVADTAFVRSRLRDRWLVEVKGSEGKKGADDRAKARTEMLSATAPSDAAGTGEPLDEDEWDPEEAPMSPATPVGSTGASGPTGATGSSR
jgi:hypothetical protein